MGKINLKQNKEKQDLKDKYNQAITDLDIIINVGSPTEKILARNQKYIIKRLIQV